MVLLQIHVQHTMADAINSVLLHRRTQKSATAVLASFLALTTPAALNVSKRLLQIFKCLAGINCRGKHNKWKSFENVLQM